MLFHFGSNGPHRRRFRLLFIASFNTVFPFSSPYTTPAVTGGGQGQSAVLSLFRKCGSRFRGPHCNSGKCAALVGFRDGGWANPCRGFPLTLVWIFCTRTDMTVLQEDIYSLKAALRTGVTRIFKYLAFLNGRLGEPDRTSSASGEGFGEP